MYDRVGKSSPTLNNFFTIGRFRLSKKPPSTKNRNQSIRVIVRFGGASHPIEEALLEATVALGLYLAHPEGAVHTQQVHRRVRVLDARVHLVLRIGVVKKTQRHVGEQPKHDALRREHRPGVPGADHLRGYTLTTDQ
eukprot:1630074-Pyramimonas_sp.AAC.1